ncbi:putative mitochondrial protein [Andalucia godoyi]|uniref:Putative mitochondrial protein n=1 Tax=Andalucia godoyi TaxID=505711 RepID=A0A8K0AH68_ANDGO|nr:putative mitochondrial protein [Andalucia godoyi]|eukprot:ANDGO_01178.mRNA.1 putative mitochondrial protein
MCNANKTLYVRVYSGHWHSGASRIPEAFARQIGRLVSLIEAAVDEGSICDKNKEYVLVYNVQLAAENCGVSVNMLIRQNCSIQETTDLRGRPAHLFVDVDSGIVRNSTSALIAAGLMNPYDQNG